MKCIGVVEIRGTLEEFLESFFRTGDHRSVVSEQQSPDDCHENYREKISGVAFLSVHKL